MFGGPLENVSPGSAVALDGPVAAFQKRRHCNNGRNHETYSVCRLVYKNVKLEFF